MAADALLKQYTVQGEDEEEEQRILVHGARAGQGWGSRSAPVTATMAPPAAVADGEAEAKRAKRQHFSLRASRRLGRGRDEREGGEAGGGGRGGGR